MWYENCFTDLPKTSPRLGGVMNANQVVAENEQFQIENFDDLTEQDIIILWRSFKLVGLSGDDAWHAIMTGMALDMAFARTRGLSEVEH